MDGSHFQKPFNGLDNFFLVFGQLDGEDKKIWDKVKAILDQDAINSE